jgi:hypothetical protein
MDWLKDYVTAVDEGDGERIGEVAAREVFGVGLADLIRP